MINTTICVMSCGEATLEECLKSLKPFKGHVVFQEVCNVCPQIKALNQMVEQTNTEFLIPVDADMLLNPDAFTRIDLALKAHANDQNWHSILFPLWDTLTEKKILALKILRTKILKNNMFIDEPTPDVEHYQRLKNKGYACIDLYLKEAPIGKHVVKSKKFCYFKYRDVYQTYRLHGYQWDSGIFMGGNDIRECSKAHFDFFIRKWAESDNIDYLHCIAGMLDGITSPLENKSKTLANKYYKIDSLKAAGEYLDWYSSNNKHDQELLLF